MLGGAVGILMTVSQRGYVVDYLSLKTKNRKLLGYHF